MTIVYLLLFLSCLIRSALSDGWVLVIVCRDQYTVWTSSSPGELMAAANAAIEPWDQYIRPIEDAEEETLPCVCASKCINVCLRISLCVVSISTSFVYFCVYGFQQQCMFVFFVCVLRVKTLTQTNQEPWLLLMPTFPRQRLPSSDGKSLPLCFSASSPSIPSILSIQSAAVAVCGIN